MSSETSNEGAFWRGAEAFAVRAWPDGGFSEMTVEVFDYELEARAEKHRLAARFPAWRFRIVGLTKDARS